MEGAASAQVMLRAKVLEVLFVRACIFTVQEAAYFSVHTMRSLQLLEPRPHFAVHLKILMQLMKRLFQDF